MPAAWVSAGVGVLGALSSPSSPNIPTNGWAQYGEAGAAGAAGQMQDLYPQMQAQYQQYTNQQLNNPYAGQYQAGANAGGSMLTGAGLGAYGAGGNLYGMGNTEMGAANQALTTAFDPQHALYNQYLSNTQNQSAAANAMSGVSNSPYGGGVTGQNLTNFNIGWDQNQLKNQLAGLSAYNTAAGGVGNTYNNAAGLQSGGAAAVGQGMQMPYNATNQLAQNNIGALNAQQNAAGLGNQALSQQANAYLGAAGMGNQSNNTALQAYNYANQNQQQAMAGWGGLALQGLNAYQNYNNNNSGLGYTNPGYVDMGSQTPQSINIAPYQDMSSYGGNWGG